VAQFGAPGASDASLSVAPGFTITAADCVDDETYAGSRRFALVVRSGIVNVMLNVLRFVLVLADPDDAGAAGASVWPPPHAFIAMTNATAI